MENQLHLSRLQEEFETMAYAYGIKPTLCTLLGEYITEKFVQIWNNGRLYEKCRQSQTSIIHKSPSYGNSKSLLVPQASS